MPYLKKRDRVKQLKKKNKFDAILERSVRGVFLPPDEVRALWDKPLKVLTRKEINDLDRSQVGCKW